MAATIATRRAARTADADPGAGVDAIAHAHAHDDAGGPPQLDLAALLAPVDREEFLRDTWERAPLHVSRDRPGFYDRVLSLAAVDHILTGTDPRFPAVRVVTGGSKSGPRSYTRDVRWGKDVFSGVLDVDRALAAYDQGATLVLEALHRSWPALGDLCRRLEAEIGHPVQANVYLTPRAAQGFAPHYDTHDVLVLQVYGVKHWRVYGSPVKLPDRTQPYQAARHRPRGAPSLAVDLRPGDLLYLPRGFVHEGLTSDQHSLHVTVGISSYTWLDVFGEMLARARKDARFRASLPVRFDRLDGRAEAVERQFVDLARAFVAQGDLPDILDTLTDRFHNTRRPLLGGHLLALEQVERLTQASRLARRAGVLWRVRCSRDGSTVGVRFHGKTVTLPGHAEVALRFVLRDESFAVHEVPGLDAAGRLVLARRLVREGLLDVIAV